MSAVYVISTKNSEEDVLGLLQSAVEGEIRRLEIGLELARERLAQFEQKYGVSSSYFIEHMAAEDLEGGDDEYVQWAGEYKLYKRLQEKLDKLRSLQYRAETLP